ncbi:hypothetical protein PRNP1_005904 [Phytophthora ramorum]
MKSTSTEEEASRPDSAVSAGTSLECRPNESDSALLSQRKSRPCLKPTHSLEIPDVADEGGIDSMGLTMPMNDIVFDAATTSELFGDCSDFALHEESCWERLPEAESTETSELGEIVTVSLRPSLSDSLSKCEETPSRPATALPRPQGRKRRISRKEQMHDLRNTVSELSTKLEGLRTESRMCSPMTSPVSCAASQHVTSILEQPRSLWEQVAARQLILRCKAEEENAKLQELLASQRRTARNIRRLLRRRADDELLEVIHNSKRLKCDNNEQVFHELLHGIDTIYVDFGKLYKAKGMPAVPCPGRKRRTDPNAADGDVFVEFIDKNQVPFDFQRSERAVWKFLQGPRIHDRGRVCKKEFQQTTETSKSCVGFTCAERGLAASYVLEQRVARKYVEGDRTVFISRTIADPTTREPWPSNMKFSETMSIVVKVGSRLASGQETTIIESYLSVARYVEGGPAVAYQHWPAYVDLAANGWDRKVTFNSQEIENLLFEESIAADM